MANIGFFTDSRGGRTIPRWFSYRGWLKRALDLVSASLLLVPLAPLISVLYLLVCLDGGPGFFGHRRVGRNGQKFRCWKLRTMVPGAEAKLSIILERDPDLAAEWAAGCKLLGDPRITKLGRTLRKTGLDELPQIWNVLRGDMSLIGPRPVTEEELIRYGRTRSAYESLRPGITGLWQVSGRNSLSYEHRIALDEQYSRRLSIWLDCKVMLRTVRVILARNGH